MQAKCSMCGLVIRSRRSSKGSAQSNLLRAVRKHVWKEHRASMIRRIKEGKRTSDDNPTVQDFIAALQGQPARAIQVYQTLRKRDWIQLKRVMDAIEPLLPIDVKATWRAVEAFHDIRKGT